MAGDASANYQPWTPSLGAHTIQAIPDTGSGATGAAGTSGTLHVTAVDNAPASASVLPEEEPPAPETELAAAAPGDGGSGGGGGCGLTALEILPALGLILLRRRRRIQEKS